MRGRSKEFARKLRLVVDRLRCAKYRKGHGVHSPFVYGFVRKVLMSRTLFEGSDPTLYNALCSQGVRPRFSRQLHNTLYYIEGQSYAINDVGCDLSILLEEYPTEELSAAYQDAENEGVTLAICRPYATRERQEVVQSLVDIHGSTSVDRYSYILFFFDKKLPKQHYRL